MSSMGKTVSDLPVDIEERVSVIQESISLLERKKIDLTSFVEEKRVEEEKLNIQISMAKEDLAKVLSEQEAKVSDLNEREVKIAQKESSLDVYANSLKEKEDRINKYLGIFEKMKDVISK